MPLRACQASLLGLLAKAAPTWCCWGQLQVPAESPPEALGVPQSGCRQSVGTAGGWTGSAPPSSLPPQGLLYAASYSMLIQVPVANCSLYRSCGECILSRDPYCAWSRGACQPSALFHLQSPAMYVLPPRGTGEGRLPARAAPPVLCGVCVGLPVASLGLAGLRSGTEIS